MSHQRLTENADRRAPTTMMPATMTYTLLRPSLSAIRPKTIAPMKAPRMADPETQLLATVLKCHWAATSVATVLMTNRS